MVFNVVFKENRVCLKEVTTGLEVPCRCVWPVKLSLCKNGQLKLDLSFMGPLNCSVDTATLNSDARSIYMQSLTHKPLLINYLTCINYQLAGALKWMFTGSFLIFLPRKPWFIFSLLSDFISINGCQRDEKLAESTVDLQAYFSR